MKTSELLTRAKKYLWDGKRPMTGRSRKHALICYAINEATKDFKDAVEQQCAFDIISRDEYYDQCNHIDAKYTYVHGYIGDLLEGTGSVRDWLRCIVGVSSLDMTFVNVQKYRDRWLDHLIAEFKQAGD